MRVPTLDLVNGLKDLAVRVPWSSRWRHRSGTHVTVSGLGYLEATLEPAVIYAEEGVYLLFARAASEFLDGRFTRE